MNSKISLSLFADENLVETMFTVLSSVDSMQFSGYVSAH